MKPIIVLLGAGSASFTISITKDLILSDGLKECTFRLMDIDPSRLEEGRSAAESYIQSTKSRITIETYIDRREALKGADYVICAVKIGGYGPLEAERKIAEEHGYYRGIGDRVSCYFGGIGAYWQIRFFEDVAKDMEDVCPNALLVQTANPVFDGTNYLTRYRNIRAVGVCHGHFEAFKIADILGLERDKVTVEVVGFNHHVYLTDFRYKGMDAYPLIDKWIAEKSEDYWKGVEYNTPGPLKFAPDSLSPGTIDAYKYYGLLPIGDAIRSASPWWHHTDFQTKERWYGINGGFDSEICWAEYLRQKDVHHKKIHDTLAMGKSITEAYPLELSGEQHIPLINAMVTDQYQHFTLNIPNNGCVPGIPDDVMVEIPTQVSGCGIRGIRVRPLPRRLMDNVIYPRIRTLDNLHDAYRYGDRSLLVLELMQDHRTRSLEQAETLIDTLLAQPWNSDAEKHYR
ncbi:MAG: hypothetical protein LLF75_06355 [Eubacteriales bacterium]|nr:hypothetical protein [Eubacteriales bacterium]